MTSALSLGEPISGQRKEGCVDLVMLMTKGDRDLEYRKISRRHMCMPPRFRRKATCAVCGVTLCSRTQLHLHMKARHGTGLPGYGLNRGRRPRDEPSLRY